MRANPIEEREAAREAEADQSRRKKELIRKLAADFRALLQTPEARNVVAAFLEDMQYGLSPFNTNAMMMSRNTGMQDAAQWWMNGIRRNCPDMERKMFKERAQNLRYVDDNPSGEGSE